MNVSIQKFPKSKIELTIEIPPADFEKYLDEAFSSLAKNLEVKGFRKGFVPKEIAKEHISEQKLLEEAANLAVGDTYWKAVEESKLEPVDSPKIEVSPVHRSFSEGGKGAPSNPFVYRVLVPVLPEIALPDYKKISVKINEKNKKDFVKNIKVEEKEIDEAVLWLQKSRAKYITVNREARVRDYVKIKSKIKNPAPRGRGSLNEVERQISKMVEEEHEGIIGEGYFLPDFEKNLIGMKAGEKKIFSQEIPQNHPNIEMSGKTVDFEVDLNLVSEVELPELNDEFAKSLALPNFVSQNLGGLAPPSFSEGGIGQFENFNSFRQSISESIKTEKEEKEKQKNRQEIILEIAKESQIEIPDVLIDKRVKQEIHELQHNVEDSGLNFQDYLENIKKTEDNLKKELRAHAENQVKISLVLLKIAKAENIEVSDEEAKEKANEYLKRFSGAEEARQIDPEQLKLYYKDVIRNEKIFQLLEIC